MSFHWKWLLEGSGKSETGVMERLSSYIAITHRKWPSHDRKCRHMAADAVVAGSDPEVMSFDRKWPLEGCGRSKTGISGAFKLVRGCNSQ